jgi:hypothetical protein
MGGCAPAVRDTPTPCDGQEHSYVIRVTSSGYGCKNAILSKKKGHVVSWFSPKDTNLTIVLDLPAGLQNPFPKLQCMDNHCFSGPMVENPIYRSYDYHGTIDQTPVPDPNIIIRP